MRRIGGDEAEAVDTGGGYDHAMGGGAKGVSDSSDLTGNFETDGNGPCHTASLMTRSYSRESFRDSPSQAIGA